MGIGGRTHSRPRPLDPPAIVRFSLSFLICIATCLVSSADIWEIPTSGPGGKHLSQIRRRLGLLLAEATDGFALGDGQHASCVPRRMDVFFTARRVPQCAFQRHGSADEGARIVTELASRASHQDKGLRDCPRPGDLFRTNIGRQIDGLEGRRRNS
jgi:hypothetical protein